MHTPATDSNNSYCFDNGFFENDSSRTDFLRKNSVSNDLLFNSSAETSFELSKRSSLYIDTKYCGRRAREHFCHRVARTPTDLRVHVQRINAELQSKENQPIYSALLDLFVALESQGFLIRQRMFEKTRAFLTEMQRSFFEKNMKKGIHSYTSAPDSEFSVLIKPTSGNFDFIRKTDRRVEVDRSAIEIANDFVEFGQIGEAVAVLEQSIIREQSNIKEQKLLIDIHRHLRQRKVFQKSRRLFVDKNIEMIPGWHALYRELLLDDLK